METGSGTLKIWPQKRKPQKLLALNNGTALPETVPYRAAVTPYNGMGGTMKIDKLAARNTKWTG
jgi:hypothetical protein